MPPPVAAVGGFALKTMGKDPSLTGRIKICDLVLSFRSGLGPLWITFLLAIMAVPGGSVRSKTKSALQLERFSQQPGLSLEEVRPSCNP
jgi:hypothetical protein